MPSPLEKPAASLEDLRALQDRGALAVRTGDLTRTHQERLVKNGFLQKVMKGWYIPVRSGETRCGAPLGRIYKTKSVVNIQISILHSGQLKEMTLSLPYR